jgi:adenine-specific DNA methylase
VGKMSYIHHLCETNNKKELIEELGSTEMAEGFLEAHKIMRDKANTVPFGKLNELVDESLKTDIKTAKKESKGVKKELNILFQDIQRVN